jgi:hypothetical protein
MSYMGGVYRPVVTLLQPNGEPVLVQKILSLEEQLAEFLANDVIRDMTPEVIGEGMMAEEEFLHSQEQLLDRQLEAAMPASLADQLREEREDLDRRVRMIDDAFIEQALQSLSIIERRLEAGVTNGVERSQLELNRDNILQELNNLGIDADLVA